MAKRRSRGRKFNLRRVRIHSKSACGALAALDVATNVVTNAASDIYRLVSIDCAYSWSEIEATIDDGCTFGVAHSDYTAAEIEECLESFASMDLGDKVAQEQSNRLVREIGIISGPHSVVGGGVSFNDGRRVKTRLNWKMVTGDQLGLWIRNASNVIWTTGSSVTIDGDLWLKDSQ